jgi:hypothetical protein
MPYYAGSTANPLGFRPWNLAVSNSGLGYYRPANFVIPTSGSLGAYEPDPTAAAMAPPPPPPPSILGLFSDPVVIGLGAIVAFVLYQDIKQKSRVKRTIFPGKM